MRFKSGKILERNRFLYELDQLALLCGGGVLVASLTGSVGYMLMFVIVSMVFQWWNMLLVQGTVKYIKNEERDAELANATLLYNSIVTPDGTVLVSRHRHDYVVHKDANGNTYGLDGGLMWRRVIGNYSDCKDNSTYSCDNHDKIRSTVEWGTRGKDGKQPLKYKKIMDLDTDHIKAIIETQQLRIGMAKVFMDELDYRNGNK